jgi:TrmH family RNA methyltransferase
VERISSRQNALVKRFRQVAAGDPAGEWMLLEGEHLVAEAVGSGLDVDVVAVTEALIDGRLEHVARDFERRGTRIVVVSEPVIGAMSPAKQPSGVTAIARRPRITLEQVLGVRPALVVVVNQIQDPGNVGAIVRAAEACGATGIVVTTGSADPFGWKALRGSMGSTFRVPIAAGHSFDAALYAARTAGLRAIATTAAGGTPLPACDLRRDCAILLGAEGSGLPPSVVAASDERLTIPMRAPVESLNVAVSAALILYEAARQRAAGAAMPQGSNVAV